MSSLSAFSPLGMWSCSGADSHAESVYRSIISGLGEFNTEPGSRMEARAYCWAMMLARVKYTMLHAAGQALPATVDVLLPPTERVYGLVPGPRDTIDQRRATLGTRRRVPKAPSRLMVESAIREIVGDAFVAVVPTPIADAVVFPSFGDYPMLLLAPSVTRKLIRILDPMFPSIDEPIRYESLQDQASASGALLEPGDMLVIEPETMGVTETLTVVAVGTHEDGSPTFSADPVFEWAHSAGATAAQMPFPAHVSSKRHTLVVLTPAAAADASTRRKVHEFMNRTMRATSTWSIVGGAGGETGVFTIGTSLIGSQTLGTVEYD